MGFWISRHNIKRSDQESYCGSKESIPADLEEVLELLIGGEELYILDIAVVLDLTVNLVEEESLDGVVKLVFPQMATDVSHHIVRPVSMLNAVK